MSGVSYIIFLQSTFKAGNIFVTALGKCIIVPELN
jgi:hypothetical protein